VEDVALATGPTAQAGSTGAIVLFVLAAVLGGAGRQSPKRARHLATLLAGESRPATDELRGLLSDRRALLMNYGSGLLVLAVLVLMVWKPGGAS
jgi:hypothetical protein